MPIRFALVGIAFGLLLVGCGPAKLNESKTLTLDGNNAAKSLDLSAQSKAQTITVDFASSDGEVFVGVFKKSDLKDDNSMLDVEKGKALAFKRGKADKFTVEVPENTATRVVVREHSAAKTDVILKVTNAK